MSDNNTTPNARPQQKYAFRTAIFNCARCGKDHTNLLFVPFKTPDGTKSPFETTHYSSCPTNGEPIMLIRNGEEDVNRNGTV